MINRLIPTSIRKWIQFNKKLNACREFNRSHLNHAYANMIKDIDIIKLNHLLKDSHSALSRNCAAAPKYYNHKEWLKKNILRAASCELHIQKNKKILDMGCGPGWFLSVCRHFGHDATGMELPTEQMKPEDRIVYQNIPKIIHCEEKIIQQKIQPFTPIQLKGDFDLITGFQVCFNNHKTETVWGVAEWQFFIEDLKTHLTDQGSILFELNSDGKNFPDLIYYDQDTYNLFLQHGSVDKHRIRLG